MFKFIANICLIYIIISVASSDDLILNNCVLPIEYTVKLSIYSRWGYFSIQSDSSLNITCSSEKVSVFKKLCHWNDNAVRLSINDSKKYLINSSLFLAKENLYRLDIRKVSESTDEHTNVLTPDIYTMTAKGDCYMNCQGCFTVFQYVNDNSTEKVFISHNPDNGVAWILPLWSDRASTAKFTITVEHDNDYSAVSHMPVRELWPAENYDFTTETERVVTKFQTTSDILTELVTVVLLPQSFNEVLADKSSFIQHTLVRYRRHILKYVTNAMNILEKVTREFECVKDPLGHFGCWVTMSSHFQPVQYIALPDYERITITPGLVLLRESDIIYDEQVMLPMQEVQFELSVASKAIYHALVEWSNADQRYHSWYNEMILNYFAFTELYQIDYKQFNNSRSMNVYLLHSQWDLLYFNIFTESQYQQDDSNDDFSFAFFRNSTAFRAMRMIDLLLGNSPGAIWASSMKYMQVKSHTSYSIWIAITDIIDKLCVENLKLENITSALDMWMSQDNFMLKVNRNYDTNSAQVIIANCSTRVKDFTKCYTWFVPVVYTLESSISNTVTTWIPPNHSNVTITDIPSTDYLIVNRQQIGYFRVNYDLENWKRLGRYLNSSNTFRDPVTCAQILDDAFYFLVRNARNRTDVDIFFELASYLERETDYTVWYPMITSLEYLSRYFPLEEGKYITDKVSKLLDGFFTRSLHTARLLIVENDTLVYNLKYEVLKWACILKNYQCSDHIMVIVDIHIFDPEIYKIPLGWKDWMYCYCLRTQNVNYKNSDVWHKLRKINDWLPTKELEFLTCSLKNYETIFDALCLLKKQIRNILSYSNESNPLQEQKIINEFFLQLVKRSDTKAVLELVLNYIQIIKNSEYRIENTLAILAVIINSIYSQESRTMIEVFILNIENDAVHVNIEYDKYEKNLIVDALKRKLNERFLFKWRDRWIY